ncbi:BACON domain-containing protein [Sphingobacterium faecale]|uniref:BACON domain-containing protein n=1 Tax=Sphingobacterium faecale TaxID=2803775 RepID=A0ABS1R167_9SPHI|nr:BACON domain-containing protein [Sphingobacterium faecale]MBL1408437.1 BACON domain-containing protein [Sphingobacterium faecale]
MKYKKSIFWNIIFLLSCFFFSTCSKEDNTKNVGTRLQVSKSQISVIQSGRLLSGSKAAINVLSNLGYQITSDVDWVKVDKPIGKGKTDVILEVEENTSGDIRMGYLTISSKELKERVKIIQTMELDTDDGKSVGFVYLEDDFSWCEEFGGVDEIENQATGTTINANTVAVAKIALNSRGYEDVNPGANCFYLGKHYFKMGKTNYQTGVRLNKIPNLESGKTTNIKLSFNATPIRTGSGNYDNVQVVVEIEGPGSVGAGSKKISGEINIQNANGGPWYWVSQSLELYGVEERTKITLKTTKSGSETGTFRWSLNDIKIEKITTN